MKPLSGWRRNSLAFALGICATLTLAPFYIFPLIIPAYGGLFLLLSGANSKKRAFSDGWWWGWGFYISGLYWFCVALLTDPEKFGWAIPFCLFGLNAIIALYPALACLLFLLLTNQQPTTNNHTKCLAFASIWLLVEYARGHLFTGFPWNLAGYSFGFSDISLQSASLLGAYGLTFFTVLLGASAVLIRTNRIFAVGVWSLFAISLLWGWWRLDNATEGEPTGAVLRVVQANVSVPHNWNPQLQQKELEDYVNLTQSAGLDKVTHVIWPETATPYALRSGSPLARDLGAMLPAGVKLITGALRIEGKGRDFQIYNSVVMLDNNGEIIGSYDKHALVPFGEFMPLRYLIPKSLKLPVGDKDFSAGIGTQTLEWLGLPPVSPLICYESIFPEYAADAANRPAWLLNVTNDVWFGMSSGPYQHFQMARMRAVEQGLPLVRAANTGISAYINEYGIVKSSIKLGEKDIFNFLLHKSQLNGTIHTRYNNMIILLLICIGIIYQIFCKKLTKN